MFLRLPRARVALPAVLALVLLVTSGVGAATATTKLPPRHGPSREQRIERAIAIAKRQIGDPWVWGRSGPAAFDCIGLVLYSFSRAGARNLMFRGSYSVRGTWAVFKRHHRANRVNPRRGDLVVWGKGKHIGIYLGRGRAISALTSGVRIHRVNQLTDPFTAYLHIKR